MHVTATSWDATRTSPIDADLVVAFDRLLNPYTVTRQAIALRDAFGQAPPSPVVTYDPITRTVTLTSPNGSGPWLLPNQPYKLILGVPKDAADVGGLRAIDGATLERPVVLEFLTTPAAGAPKKPPVSYREDVAPKLGAACASCHHATAVPPSDAAMGLELDSADALARTAIDRPSRALATGAHAGTAPPSAAFGVGMPIVAPGNPGHSALLYRLLAWGEPARTTALETVAERIHTPLADEEAARLRALLSITAMPPTAPALDFRDAESLRAWIADGAKLDGP